MKRATLISIALALLVAGGTPRSESGFVTNAAISPAAQTFSTVPLYRLYVRKGENPRFLGIAGFHFYTTDINERNGVIKDKGYGDEGIAGYVLNQQAPGTVPLYRLSKMVNDYGGLPVATKRFYTTDKAEADNAVKNFGFKREGIQCYVAARDKPLSGTVPLYRVYHPASRNSRTGAIGFSYTGDEDHFYTTDPDEKYKAITQLKYADEGIACYVWPEQTDYHTVPRLNATPKTDAGNPDTYLLNRGCTRTGVGAYDCPTVGGYEACEVYRKDGRAKACTTPRKGLLQQAAKDKELFSLGCTRLLGRPDEYICKTQKSLDACETYRTNGKLKKCVMAKQ
jgi:hypothetical protein